MNDRLFPEPAIPCECGGVAMLCGVRVGCYYLAYVCEKCGRGGNAARQSTGFPDLSAMRNALDGDEYRHCIKYNNVNEAAFRKTWDGIKQRIDRNDLWKHHSTIGDFV
jgi:hypothetical protein